MEINIRPKIIFHRKCSFCTCTWKFNYYAMAIMNNVDVFAPGTDTFTYFP